MTLTCHTAFYSPSSVEEIRSKSAQTMREVVRPLLLLRRLEVFSDPVLAYRQATQQRYHARHGVAPVSRQFKPRFCLLHQSSAQPPLFYIQ